MSKKRIINILKDLADTDPDRISVSVSDKKGTIRVKHKKHHGVDFIFQWYNNDHYVGKFIDANGSQSQAVVTLKKPIHAIYFVSAYRLLDDIRAMQRSGD